VQRFPQIAKLIVYPHRLGGQPSAGDMHVTEIAEHSDPFVANVRRFIDERALIAPGAGVVVGVSGGADSVALLSALRAIAGETGRGYRLTVAHLNHALRQDADADEDFVLKLAEKWQLPHVSARRDVKAAAALARKGTEETARMLRYEFLRETAEACEAKYAAVGHHADDNVETILYRILRGTHLRGLSGIPASRVMAGAAVCLVRPLLWSRREEVEAYCRREGLLWRIDSTNADTSYRRNFIRNELLPLVTRNLNPRADEALLRLAAAAGELEAYLGDIGRAALEKALRPGAAGVVVLDVGTIAAEAPVVRRYALRGALERLRVPLRTLDAERLSDLAGLLGSEQPSAVSLGGGYVARRVGGRLVVEAGGPEEPAAAETAELNLPGRTDLPGGGHVVCQVEPFSREAFEAHCSRRAAGVELLDADCIRGGLVMRARREGDVFVPLGAPGRKSVSDFLTNLKLPRRAREDVRCICDDLGIVYVAPLRIDERVKVTEATSRVLRLRIAAGES
jgi:tRNA(Ile)-lysidine synthase